MWRTQPQISPSINVAYGCPHYVTRSLLVVRDFWYLNPHIDYNEKFENVDNGVDWFLNEEPQLTDKGPLQMRRTLKSDAEKQHGLVRK